MECKTFKRNISCWVDGELKATQKVDFEEHLRGCASCQKEVETFQVLNSVLRQTVNSIEPSWQFDTVFWDKVADRQKTPWLVKLLNDLEDLIPTPNLKQAVAFATLAFFVGNFGGVVSTMRGGVSGDVSPASIRQLSALQEFNGIPAYSLAATYLKTIKSQDSK